MVRLASKAEAICLFLAVVSPAIANDTNAVVAAGGLQFVKTDELRIEQEDLIVSKERIHVAYRIRNLTDHDIRTLIAFPLPEIDAAAFSETPHEFHNSQNDGDVVNFRLRIDGKEVEPGFDARALTPNGVDVTELLRKNHLALTAWRPITEGHAVVELVAAGAVLDDDEHHPNWSVKAAYHWEQIFPANAVVAVTHDYQPVVGAGEIGKSEFQESGRMAAYCPDKSFVDAASRLSGWEVGGTHVSGHWLDYVLTTGANWAGPIGKFRLEIKKGDADLVSLCAIPKLRLHRSGQSFIAEGDAFTPTSDLKILFISGKR